MIAIAICQRLVNDGITLCIQPSARDSAIKKVKNAISIQVPSRRSRMLFEHQEGQESERSRMLLVFECHNCQTLGQLRVRGSFVDAKMDGVNRQQNQSSGPMHERLSEVCQANCTQKPSSRRISVAVPLQGGLLQKLAEQHWPEVAAGS
jgi:hypothetical protein